jgi:hypothetical protein
MNYFSGMKLPLRKLITMRWKSVGTKANVGGRQWSGVGALAEISGR